MQTKFLHTLTAEPLRRCIIFGNQGQIHRRRSLEQVLSEAWWGPMEIWVCHLEAWAIFVEEIGLVSLLMARRACCSWLRSSQGAENSVLFNLSVNTKWGLRKGPSTGLWHSRNPTLTEQLLSLPNELDHRSRGCKEKKPKQRQLGGLIPPTLHLKS